MKKILIAAAAMTVLLFIGCSYTTQSRLPSHIKTISVGVFGNSTTYLHLEQELTTAIIKEINLSPHYKVVNGSADAELSGEIVKVRNVVIEYDANNQPKNMQISMGIKFSLYDNVAQEFIFTNQVIENTQSSSLAGRYSVDKGDGWASAANVALEEAAKLIVRQIMTRKNPTR